MRSCVVTCVHTQYCDTCIIVYIDFKESKLFFGAFFFACIDVRKQQTSIAVPELLLYVSAIHCYLICYKSSVDVVLGTLFLALH